MSGWPPASPSWDSSRWWSAGDSGLQRRGRWSRNCRSSNCCRKNLFKMPFKVISCQRTTVSTYNFLLGMSSCGCRRDTCRSSSDRISQLLPLKYIINFLKTYLNGWNCLIYSNVEQISSKQFFSNINIKLVRSPTSCLGGDIFVSTLKYNYLNII